MARGVRVAINRSYYGGNNSNDEDKAPEEMIIHAVELLDDEVDFSQYDTDDDGFVDNVYVFYAGRGEADGGGTNSVWPRILVIDVVEVGQTHHVREFVDERAYAVGFGAVPLVGARIVVEHHTVGLAYSAGSPIYII